MSFGFGFDQDVLIENEDKANIRVESCICC